MEVDLRMRVFPSVAVPTGTIGSSVANTVSDSIDLLTRRDYLNRGKIWAQFNCTSPATATALVHFRIIQADDAALTSNVEILASKISVLPAGFVFTADSGTDVLTVAGGHTFLDGDVVGLSNSGGGLPSGLAAATNYWVINRTATTFQVSLTPGGAAVNFTTNGTGTHTATLNPFVAGMKPIVLLGEIQQPTRTNQTPWRRYLGVRFDNAVAVAGGLWQAHFGVGHPKGDQKVYPDARVL